MVSRLNQVLLSLSLLFMLVSASFPQEPPPLRSGLESTTEWPVAVPMPDDATGKVASRRPGVFAGEYTTPQGLDPLQEFYRNALLDRGWDITQESASRESFHLWACKGALTLTVGGMEGIREDHMILINLVDKNQACTCDENTDAAYAGELALEGMRNAYRNASTYTDRGTCRTTTRYGSHVKSEENEAFVMAFVRGAGFRMEIVDDISRFILHQSGKDIQSYSTLRNEREKHSSMMMAMAGAGATDIAQITPPLLMPELPGWMIDYSCPRLTGIGSLNGRECHLVETTDQDCMPSRFWIDVQDNLLLRYEDLRMSSDSEAYEVIDFQPLVNSDVPPNSLDIDLSGKLALQKEPSLATKVLDKLQAVLR